MIVRDSYISRIRGFYQSDLIKIITGVRRSGKSVILEQIRDELQKQTDHIIYLNFEDKAVINMIPTADALIDYIDSKRGNQFCYVFLDEIQMLDDWAIVCKTLRLHNCSLFITGSNSKLLSREFTKELSGRYVAFQVRPFVFEELEQYAVQLNKNITVTDYLIWGGFPKRIEFDTEEQQRQYLNDLDETIVVNDIINRYKIRKTDEFRKLVNYILVSNARIFSQNSIYEYMKSHGSRASANTIKKWVGYLEEAYIISSIPQYSTRTKTELEFYEKIYNCDVALNSIRKFNARYDLSHNLENIVYNELLYRGYEVKVFNNKGREIDFIATKNGLVYYIQAALSIAEDKAYEREFSAFKGLNDFNQKIIITNDDIDYSTSMIRHIRLADFLHNGLKQE